MRVRSPMPPSCDSAFFCSPTPSDTSRTTAVVPMMTPMAVSATRPLRRARSVSYTHLDVYKRQILIQAANESAIDGVMIDASTVLRQSHDIAFRDDDDFRLLTQGDFIQAFGEVTTVLTLFLLSLIHI